MAGAPLDVTLVLLEVSLIIFLAELVRTGLSKFLIPALVGEVLVGFLLGPHSLGGMINELLGVPLFTVNEYLLFLSELAVILLVFAAGLEHGVAPLKEAGIYGYMAAVSGALFPALVAFLVYSPILGYGTALIMGTALGATSLAAVSSIIVERKLKGRPVDFLMTSAAVDDVVDLILLSVVLAFIGAQTAFNPLTATQIVLYYVVAWLVIFLASIYIIPRLANRVGDWLIDEFFFVVLFGLVAIMVILGFSPVIAAFIAGVALAESIKREKVAHISEVLLAVFGPLFFVSVGMQINPTSFLNLEAIYLTLELTAIAFVFKMLGILPFAYLSLRDFKSSLAVSVGMTPRGEVGLVVAYIGKTVGALNEVELLAIVLMAVLTTLIGATLFSRLAKWIINPNV
jgi:Kef-type K+ transport system membrane component KefB